MAGAARAYRLTTVSAFVGIFVQALVSNLTAILFIPLMEMYDLSYVHLGILVGVNFAAQVAADIIFSRIIDKVPFKSIILPADICAFAGLILYGLTPVLFADHIFAGIIISTVIFSAASGILEVILSPLVDSIPNEAKGPAMSLMHSFYAWGQVATIIVTTLFIYFAGKEYWQIIVFIWALVPFINFFMFLKAPYPPRLPEEQREPMSKLLFHPFYLLALAAIFAGASTEVVMNQWASTYMEKAMALPKITGDLVGMCGFAVMLGLGRMLYGIFGAKINMSKVLVCGSAMAFVCYLVVALSPAAGIGAAACAITGFAASLLWPGTLVVSSERFPMAGAWMFAILAAAGDIGASVGPWLVGLITDHAGPMLEAMKLSADQAPMRAGILIAAVFPLIAFIVHSILAKMIRKEKAAVPKVK